MRISGSEVITLSTTNFIHHLTKSFVTYAKKKKIEMHPSVFVQGQPGVGKSQAVYDIAEKLKQTLNKKVIVTDIRLLLFNPIDLRGIPVADRKRKESIWLRPQVFNFDASDDVVNILFLDELTAAPSSLQAAAYQIALDRRLGEHRLPDNTFIVASGNRTVDHGITYDMPTPLRNRFMHFELTIDFDSWLEWAKDNQIHPEIISFLKKNPDKFSTSDFDTSSYIIVTPRNWEFLSNILYTLGGDIKEHQTFIASIIGTSLTSLMLNSTEAIDIEDIIEGKINEEPKNMSDLQRVVDILDHRLEDYANNKEYIQNILNYLLKIPMDYSVRLFRKLIKIHDLDYDISTLNSYQLFIQKLGDIEADE